MSALLAPPSVAFTSTVRAIPAEAQARMRGRSWRDDPRCPAFADLAWIEVDHLGFDGDVHRGQIVVAASLATPTVALLARLFAIGFPLRSLVPIDAFDADDDASMAADNASGFCFRDVAGTTRLSRHALGLAIDLNPVENPWLAHGRVSPPAGVDYLDRTHVRPGMIVRPGPVTAAFDELGWEWGGDWHHARDLHHIVWAARDRRE